MHRDLVDEDHESVRHRTAHLIRENRQIVQQARRSKRTMDSGHEQDVAPNLVEHDQ